jgi:TnpA family transposase
MKVTVGHEMHEHGDKKEKSWAKRKQNQEKQTKTRQWGAGTTKCESKAGEG